MTKNEPIKIPSWYWVVSILALLWNLAGVANYLMQVLMTEEIKNTLPLEQVSLIEQAPSWGTAVFAIAVWSAFFACIGLLLRKKWSKPLFLISLIAVCIQMGYSILMTDAIALLGPIGLLIPISTIVIALFLYFFANIATKKQWLK
jgi:hypothetical protein